MAEEGSIIYLEHQKKLKVLREMLERSIIDDGEYPDKKYVNQLLEDISTRLAIFDYEKVKPDTKLDLAKMNKDFYCIRKDLGILYEIVEELAGKKYRELEAYIRRVKISKQQRLEQRPSFSKTVCRPFHLTMASPR